MTKRYTIDPKDIGEDGLIKDGGVMKVPTYLMGYATVSDAAAALQNLSIKDRAVALADIGRTYGSKQGFFFVADSDAAVLKAVAYHDYANDISNAWRRQITDGQPGDPCTTSGGQPGRLCKEGGKLVCRPLKSSEPSNSEWAMAGSLSDSKSVELKDAALKEYEERIQSAWRR